MKQVFKIASVLTQTEKKLTLQVLALGMLLEQMPQGERVKRVMDTIKVEDNYQPLLSGFI
jgi:hypothetical protein